MFKCKEENKKVYIITRMPLLIYFELVVRMKMPTMYLKPVWTPLKWFKISIFRDMNNGRYYYRIGHKPLKAIGNAS